MNLWQPWTWTENMTYPETLDTKVYVMFRDGSTVDFAISVKDWMGKGEPGDSNWDQSGNSAAEIIAYKVVAE